MNEETRTSEEVSKSSLGLRTKGKDQAEISSQEGMGTLSKKEAKEEILKLIEEGNYFKAANKYEIFIENYGEPFNAWEVELHA